MATRRQHHVWCHYLRGWCREDGRVVCSRQGNIFCTNPINIMVERDFYRLAPLAAEDVRFIEFWLEHKCEPGMQSVNRAAFEMFARIAAGEEAIERTSSIADADKELVRCLAIEAEENLHARIEDRAVPLIDQLRRECTGFLHDQDSAISFFHFLAHQYFRTKTMREKVGEILSTLCLDHDFGGLRNIFCYCFANNFGGSLYCDRNKLDLVFLRNAHGCFVTGDQPIVNLAWKESMNHDDVVLFYPLSPFLGAVLSAKKHPCRSMSLCDDVVHQLNRCIAFASEQCLVSNSKDVLIGLEDKPKERPEVLSMICESGTV